MDHGLPSGSTASASGEFGSAALTTTTSSSVLSLEILDAIKIAAQQAAVQAQPTSVKALVVPLFTASRASPQDASEASLSQTLFACLVESMGQQRTHRKAL